MTDLVTLVIQAATIRRLEMECGPIDREVQQLVAEMEHLSVEECRHGKFLERFMELLRRRGEIAREVLVKSKAPQTAKTLPRSPLIVPEMDHSDSRILIWGNKVDEPEVLQAQAEQLLAMVHQVRDSRRTQKKLIGEAIVLQKRVTR